MSPRSDSFSRLVLPTTAALVVTLIALAWIYGYRISLNPAKWEEPRRCLVAMEMIERGDYVVPHLFGEPYLNKPPFQNWMIVLLSGNRVENVDPFRARMLSLVSVVGVALLLWRLGLSGLRPRPDPAPALIFLSFALVVQGGRAGEIDMLFCLLISAAIGLFELGRRAGSPALRFVLSQAIVGVAVLTKGFAPVLVYPPLIHALLRRRERGATVLFGMLAGLLAAGLIVAIWLVPFSMMAPDLPLQGRWKEEFAKRVSSGETSGWLVHLARYPLSLLVVLLPWSLAILAAGVKPLRRTWRQIRADPWLELCAASLVCGAAVFLIVPNFRERYLLPILPFGAVLIGRLLAAIREEGRGRLFARLGSSRVYWAVLALLVALGAAAGYLAWLERFREQAWIALAVGWLMLIVLAFTARSSTSESTGLPILALALVYGVIWTGIAEPRAAEQTIRFVDDADRIADELDPALPLVVHERLDRKLGWNLSKQFGRIPRYAARIDGPYQFVAPVEAVPRPGAVNRLTLVEHALYVVHPPEPRSLLGARLDPPALPPEVAAEREAQYADAERTARARMEEPEAMIWWGRRAAYLGRYREAIDIFTRGSERSPEDPRFYRHRGHRYITLRRFDWAIADFERAVERMSGKPDEVEPDGLPNARNLPRTTLQFNVWYHLGLAHYLRGDWAAAEQAYRRCLEVSRNDDAVVAASHWLYMTLRRQADDGEAVEILRRIDEAMEIIENDDYHELLIAYKNEGAIDALEQRLLAEDDGIARATLAYGVANWHLYNGEVDRAHELFGRIADGEAWAAFGYIAAEAELARSAAAHAKVTNPVVEETP